MSKLSGESADRDRGRPPRLPAPRLNAGERLLLIAIALVTVVGTAITRASREWPRFFPGLAGAGPEAVGSRETSRAGPEDPASRARFGGAPTLIEERIGRVLEAIEKSEGEKQGAANAPRTPLDPNRASAEELESLPGIGPVLAARIVRERETHGPFRRVEDLDRVPGIGPRLVEKLRPELLIGAASSSPGRMQWQPAAGAPRGRKSPPAR